MQHHLTSDRHKRNRAQVEITGRMTQNAPGGPLTVAADLAVWDWRAS
jgi:hypothetical protein